MTNKISINVTMKESSRYYPKNEALKEKEKELFFPLEKMNQLPESDSLIFCGTFPHFLFPDSLRR